MKGDEKLLRDMRIVDFTDELSSDSPAPGGGSIAALCGSIAASLASMVAALTCGKKKKMPDVYDEMAQLAEKAQDYKDRLNWLIDEDTAAFNKVMDAMKLPKGTEAEKAARTAAMDTANLYAAEIPLNTLKTIQEMVGLVKIVVEKGNPSSITDGGVGGLMARAGAKGAWYNVMINLSGIDNQADKDRLTKEAKEALQTVNQICDEIETLVEKAL
jgi:glutamate formiminotransferase/formiminotetrahydrofolate cyclodeaminase